MGLFSKIGKAIGGVFKGVAKVFKPITGLVQKGLSKIVGKKWAKRIMLGAAIFMGGTALIAGVQGFMGASGGLWTKLVTGGKEFIAALAHPIKGAKSILPGGGQLTGATGTLNAGAAAGAATTPAASGVAPAATEGVPAATAASGAASATTVPTITAPTLGSLPGTGPIAPAGGMLSKAAGGILDYSKTAGGGLLLGNVIAGIGEASAQKSMLKYQNRNNVPFTADQLAMMNRPVETPPGYLSRAKQIMDMLGNRPFGSAPVQPGDPAYVASLARGG